MEEILMTVLGWVMAFAPFLALGFGLFTDSPTKSAERTLQTNQEFLHVTSLGGKIRYAEFNYTHAAGAGVGEIDLTMLAAGKIKVLPRLSYLHVDDLADAAAVVSIGYRAYYTQLGVAVAEDPIAFQNQAAAGAGVINAALSLPADGVADFDTQRGLEIFATVETGNIADGEKISGYLAYVDTN